MKPAKPALIFVATMLVVAACSAPAGRPSEPSSSASASLGSETPSLAAGAASMPPEADETQQAPTGDVERVTYDWGVPSSLVTISHAVRAPIAPPPDLPLPSLVAIEVGDHPDSDPGFERIAFTFHGAFPGYTFQYVPEVTADPSGSTIPLEGNGFLSVVFLSAQAHDNSGASTVIAAPRNVIGYRNLKSYGFAGDYEGYVSYGLGIEVAPDSDQVLLVRAGEIEKRDASGGLSYIVYLDVQTG